jgi:hypothetical protein
LSGDVFAGAASVRPYLGLAWEHEFAGRVEASSHGLAIDPPSLRGDSGRAELGLFFMPSEQLPLSMDLGVQGYVGTREGVSGSFRVTWKF